MPGQQLQTEALVLTRKPSADRFQTTHRLLGPAWAACSACAGSPRKTTSTSAILDLFDETDLYLETSNEGRTWFIKEARVLLRHEAIGRSYDALRLASAFVTIIARNPVHEESRAGVYRLLQQTFAAFGSTSRPDLVYLKACTVLRATQGYIPSNRNGGRD